MGAKASKPVQGAKFQVIGAGLPRTGTASFCHALEILLQGPVYHSGTQMLVTSDETQIRTQIEMLKRTPISSPADRAFVLQSLRAMTTGFVAAADSSMCQFVPELMDLYPDAIVICTTRDPDKWAKSMGALATTTTQTLLAVMLFWVPSLRYFPQWVRVLHEGRWGELYIRPGERPDYGNVAWERHMEYLRREVPKERLHFYDVKQGWEPLCEILKVPVPDVEFSRMNDSKAMDDFATRQIMRGLLRWAGVLAVAGVLGYFAMR